MPKLIEPLENLVRSNLKIELSYVEIEKRGMPVEDAEILVSKLDIGYVIGFLPGVKAVLDLDLNKRAEYPVLRFCLPFETNAVSVAFPDCVYTIHRTSETLPASILSSFEKVSWTDYEQRRRELEQG